MTRFKSTGTILDQILARTEADLESRRQQRSLSDLEARIDRSRPRASLAEALSEPGLSVIAEIKRGSPSKGVFPVEIDPASLAAEYVAGGASAVSVLTDEPFFHGSLADLETAARVAHGATPPRPALRKDFVLDTYQIAEAALHGGDAVLLIVAALAVDKLRALLAAAGEYGLDALVEVHDEDELAIAVESGARIIGINNRDLRTFEVDLSVSERLAEQAPDGVLLVGESGIFTEDDAQRMVDAGLDAVLVGEALVVAADRRAAIQRLKSVPATSS